LLSCPFPPIATQVRDTVVRVISGNLIDARYPCVCHWNFLLNLQ